MKCDDIRETAYALIGETNTFSDTRDYDDRFPFVLATFINQNSSLDGVVKKQLGIVGEDCHAVCGTDIFGDFPLLDRFAAPAVYYVASMLVTDENTELSDKFFELYEKAMNDMFSALPLTHGQIEDAYKC